VLSSSASVPLAHLIVLFCVLLVAGTLLTLPLYDFDYRRFIKTKLFIKIIFWIPIFLVFVGLLYMSNTARLLVWVLLLVLALGELLKIIRYSKTSNLVVPIIFYVAFSFALLHFFILGVVYKRQFVDLLITICFASVLSDVTAFFTGNYLGEHKLPAVFNKNKSWEGVAGQILGSLIGVVLVNKFVIQTPIMFIFLPIGIGAAVGDLANSYIKRFLDIKDWSNNIPGHGGYIDRLSSLAGSALLMFYFVKLFHIL
jgi:phosphatidate cytidylyltransferase